MDIQSEARMSQGYINKTQGMGEDQLQEAQYLTHHRGSAPILPGSASKGNNQVVQDFLDRQQSQIKLKENMSLEHSLLYQSDGHDRKNGSESFAEKYSKFTVREYTNNTRLNIKNAGYLA